jgi:hypothetical protein
MSFHTCWDVKAPEDTPGVPVPEVLNRLYPRRRRTGEYNKAKRRKREGEAA